MTISLNLGEKHTIRDKVLLHFGVEFVFEALHPVVENDFRQIHLLTHHHFIHTKPIPIVESKILGVLMMTNLLNTNYKAYKFMPTNEFA